MAKAKTKVVGKGVAVRASRDVATMADDAELLAQIAADSGAGFEEATRDAYAVPFLRVLQDLSPQVKKKMAGYVEGAAPGMIYNTVTKEVFTALRVIPCYYSQAFIEWIPRTDKAAGGGNKGFVAAHPATTPLVHKCVREGSRNMLPNGHELQDTRQHFVLFVREDGTIDQGMIAMASTQLKVSRRWMSQMKSQLVNVGGRQIPAPMFAYSYLLASEEEANDQGSWYSWTVNDAERITDPDTYSRARAFRDSMLSGKVKVNYEEGLEDPNAHSAATDAPPRDMDEEEEIDA